LDEVIKDQIADREVK